MYDDEKDYAIISTRDLRLLINTVIGYRNELKKNPTNNQDKIFHLDWVLERILLSQIK